MSDLVRYHNDFNNIILKNFTDRELDLLMAICFKLKNQDTNELTLEFKELKDLMKYEDRNLNKFINIVDNTYNKLLNARFRYEDDTQIDNILFFTRYKVSKLNQNVLIKVNEDFKYLLNELTSNYTKFELEQFTSLKSNYGKLIFKLLKQFDSTGKREFKIEDFRRLLDIPESYRISEINSRVLRDSTITELEKAFKNLKIEKSKKHNERNVSKIIFTWDKIETKENYKYNKKLEKNPITSIKEIEETMEEKIKNAISSILMKDRKKNMNKLQDLAKLNNNEELSAFAIDNNLDMELIAKNIVHYKTKINIEKEVKQ